jgi:hypothetical protein
LSAAGFAFTAPFFFAMVAISSLFPVTLRILPLPSAGSNRSVENSQRDAGP